MTHIEDGTEVSSYGCFESLKPVDAKATHASSVELASAFRLVEGGRFKLPIAIDLPAANELTERSRSKHCVPPTTAQSMVLVLVVVYDGAARCTRASTMGMG